MEKERDSSIELLKIFAIFLIIISHVVQTVGTNEYFFALRLNGTINIYAPTPNIQHLIVMSMRYLGSLGNLIFIICSS